MAETSLSRVGLIIEPGWGLDSGISWICKLSLGDTAWKITLEDMGVREGKP